jgi:hypothetical protein
MLESIGSFHGCLDLRVQSFDQAIRTPRARTIDNSILVPFDCLGHLNGRSQLTVRHPKILTSQTLPSMDRVSKFPEPRQCQLNAVGPRCSQIHGPQIIQTFQLLCCQVLRILQLEILRRLQPLFSFCFIQRTFSITLFIWLMI